MQDIRAKLRIATAEEHRRTEASFAVILASLSDSRGSDSRGSDSRGSDSRGSDSRGSDSRGSDSRGSDSRGSDSRGSNAYGAFLLAHARAFPAIGRALSAGLDWPAWRARWHDLEADLAALDLDPPHAPHVAAATSRAEALGMAYVLEGSRHGSTLLLKSIPAGLPTAYLNGGNDRAPWRLLLGLLETIAPADEAAAIAAARTAFGAFRAAAPTTRVLEPAS